MALITQLYGDMIVANKLLVKLSKGLEKLGLPDNKRTLKDNKQPFLPLYNWVMMQAAR